jgi:microcystin-dependent protein
MSEINSSAWSEVAASNTAAPPNGWPESMNPAMVDDTAREMMAALKRWYDHINPTITSGGSANAQTLTYTVAPAALVAGDRYSFIPGFTNTGAASLNVNALGATPVQTAGGVALTGGEIAVGVVTEVWFDGTNFRIFASSAAWSTGDTKVTLKTVADGGWVLFDDGTIGDATSGGTTRANADTSALFTLLWSNTTNANCAVSGGRGVSAAADFAAHKTIALPKVLGRALAVAGAGSGLTSRALAAIVGEETHALTIAELAVHNHGVTDPGHVHTISSANVNVGNDTTQVTAASTGVGNNTPVTSTGTTGISINSAGSGTAHNTMQPTTFFNVMVKL